MVQNPVVVQYAKDFYAEIFLQIDHSNVRSVEQNFYVFLTKLRTVMNPT